jgi:hypothetical protein
VSNFDRVISSGSRKLSAAKGFHPPPLAVARLQPMDRRPQKPRKLTAKQPTGTRERAITSGRSFAFRVGALLGDVL